ncbi:hypothetical protein ACFCXH_42030, partial [Streptomyces nojiriensis]
DHVLLLYGAGFGPGSETGEGLDALVRTARDSSGGRVEVCLLLAADADADADEDPNAVIEADGRTLPVYADTRGEFARLYAAEEPTAFVIRPDGYLGARIPLSPPA